MADTASPEPQPPPKLTPREVAWMVGTVPPGSVVALRGTDFDNGALAVVAGELARVSGHHQFVVVDLPAGASGSLVLVDGGLSMSVAHADGDQMPPEACAQLPHDVTGARLGRTVGSGAPANWGCTIGDEGERQERD